MGGYLYTRTLGYTLKIWPFYAVTYQFLKLSLEGYILTYKDIMRIIYAISQKKNSIMGMFQGTCSGNKNGLWSPIDLGLNSNSATY